MVSACTGRPFPVVGTEEIEKVEDTVIDCSAPGTVLPLEEILSNRNVKSVNFSGQDVELDTIHAIKKAFPDCEILWTVPIGGTDISSDTEKLELESIEEKDILKLDRFENLVYLEVHSCDTPNLLDEFQKNHPEILVVYTKNILGVPLRNVDTYLDLFEREVTAEEIEKELSENPQIKEVNLVGSSLSNEEKAKLHTAFPDITFDWMVDIGNYSYKSTRTDFDFTPIRLNGVEELAQYLHCFMHPSFADVATLGFENSDMEWLMEQFPETKFAWMVRIGSMCIRTDIQVLDCSLSTTKLSSSSIQPLKYCTDILALNISKQNIENIEVLSSMKNLKVLRMNSNSITDLSPVSGLKDLEYLEADSNAIEDVSALSGLKNLKYLNISKNNVSDFSPLLQCMQIKKAFLAGNPGSEDSIQINAVKKVLPELQIEDADTSGWKSTEEYSKVNYIFKSRIFADLDDSSEVKTIG